MTNQERAPAGSVLKPEEAAERGLGRVRQEAPPPRGLLPYALPYALPYEGRARTLAWDPA